MKVKKKWSVFLFVLLAGIMTGCGSSSETEDSILETAVEDSVSVMSEEEENLKEDDSIDIDLTSLSSTMVYSEVSHMMYEPENYIGKIIKMDGTFSSYYDEATGNYYFACIIKDATACCAQGFEFELTDDYTYPDDYPKEGDPVSVVGEFDTYQDGEYLYCTLRNARLLEDEFSTLSYMK